MRVMLLIDADNVSVDVIEATVAHLLAEFGALHGRRAYCNAESALKHQSLFKQLGIRPMVNLAAGKNSTDIALAVDAIELVMRERPEVLAIASSDSDFAPLVTRVREKGCRVLGFGQQGKTGEATVALYDRFVQFSAKGLPADAAPPKKRAPAKKAAAEPKPVPVPASTPTPAKKAARKTAAKPPAKAPPPPAEPPRPEEVQRLLAAMPELQAGAALELGPVAETLRKLGLLSRRASSSTWFKRFAAHFELSPAQQPNKVALRA